MIQNQNIAVSLRFSLFLVGFLLILVAPVAARKKATLPLLKAEQFKHYVDYFNRMEEENIVQAIPNSGAWDWMKENIPLFECPQDNFEEIYYFRWWSLRKHIQLTPSGYCFTEFLVKRSYADQYNLISCALGHHIMEARWLRNPIYLNQYVHLWYRGKEGKPMAKLHRFSSWSADAVYQKYLVDGDVAYLTDMLPDLEADYQQWERENQLPNGLFWQHDVRDGMEEQISGGRKVKNARPTINSYMFGNASALAKMAGIAGNRAASRNFQSKADTLKYLILNRLWNPASQFFETVREDGNFARVREEIGFIPWYFNLPGKQNEAAWSQVKSDKGFLAPFGLTTAERNHPMFRTHGCCNCEWDGAIWPFATAQTLTGMANWLNSGESTLVNDSVYFSQLQKYVESQYKRGRPYVGEYLDEVTGYWLKGDEERSRYYNHSTFNDLIITGLIGLRPESSQSVEVHPLLPEGKWDWFCLDQIRYHDHLLTILWDRYGTRYHLGKGFFVLVDGKVTGHADALSKVVCNEVLK